MSHLAKQNKNKVTKRGGGIYLLLVLPIWLLVLSSCVALSFPKFTRKTKLKAYFPPKEPKASWQIPKSTHKP
jgi:hypothetical protein